MAKTTREEREAILLKSIGKDPSTHSIDSSGKVISRTSPEAPAPTDETGAFETFGRSAVGAIPETLGSLVGGGLGGAVGVPLGAASVPMLGPAAAAVPFVTGFGGSIAGGMAGHELEKELPKGYHDFVNKGAANNPIAAELGAVIPQLLTSNPVKSARVIGALARGIPTLTRFTGEQLGHIAGMGIGTGTGVAGPIAEDWNRPEGLGMDTAKRAAIRGVAGLLGSQQNRLGNLFTSGKMQPSPDVSDRWQGAGRVARDSMQQSDRAPIYDGEIVQDKAQPIDADVVEATGGKPSEQGGNRRLLSGPDAVSSQTETDAAMAKAAADREAMVAQQQGQSPPPFDPNFASEGLNQPAEPVPPNFTRPGPRKGLPEPPYQRPQGEIPESQFAKEKRLAQRAGIPLERQQGQESGQLGLTSPEWDDIIKNVGGSDYNSDVVTGEHNLRGSGGEQLAGKVELPTDLEKGLVKIAKNAGVDTGPHELLHVIVNDVLERGTSGEKAFMKRVMEQAGGEEGLVQGGGNLFTKRLINEGAGESASAGLGGDLVAFVKARFLNNATPADLKRLAARTLRSGAGSEQYRPSEGLKSQIMEDEQSLKKPSNVRNQESPIPEKAETVAKQLEVTLDPESSKAVTHLPEGSEIPSEVPSGLEMVKTPKGTAFFNPKKVSRAEVVKAGQGENFDGRLLGMSKSEKPSVSNKVVTTSKDGVPDVLTEAVATGSERAAIKAHENAVPGGVTEVKPTEEVLRERNQPLGPRETYGPEEKRKFAVFSGPVQRLAESSDPVRQKAADVFNRLFSNRDALRGKYSRVITEINKDPVIARKAQEAMHERQRTGKVPTMPLAVKQVYDVMSDTYRQMRQDQIAAGHMINGRQAGLDPMGMFTVASPDVFKTLNTADKTSPRYKSLKADYINEQLKRGFSTKGAEDAFNKYVEGLSTSNDPSSSVDFKAVSAAEGTKLPDSWIEPDPATAWERYIDRFTSARTWHDVVEKDPSVRALFEGPDSIARDPSVTEAFNSYRGVTKNGLKGVVGGVDRAIKSVILGPVTRVIDMATTPISALKYTPLSHWPELASELTKFRKYSDASVASGLNKPGRDSYYREVVGAGEYANHALDKAAKAISKYQGANKVEFAARVIAQAAGQSLGGLYKTRALAGDVEAGKMLDKLGSDWRTISNEELGARFGRIWQGTYDARNLPAWIIDSPIAPFFSMAKWSTEQWNNLVRFGIEPATRGNYKPLIQQLTIALALGGPALAMLREKMTGKKPYIASIEEIKNAPDKTAATKAAIAKIANFMQATSQFGIVGDLVNDLAIKPMSGQLSSGGFSWPGAEIAKDAALRSAKALEAVLSGANLGDVLKQYAKDVVLRNAQIGQIVNSHSEDTRLKNLARDYRIYRRLQGKNDATPVTSVDYSRASERSLDDMNAKEGLVKRKSLNAEVAKKFKPGSQEYDKEMDKLDSSRQQFFPTDPMEQRAYMNWLTKTQGKERALEAEKAWRAWTVQEQKKRTYKTK
jgi:hypothetical protein